MIKFLDLLSYWTAIIGAATVVISMAIVAAYIITKEEAPIWQILHFKRWISLSIILIAVTKLSGWCVTNAARDEIHTLTKQIQGKRIVIYNGYCSTIQTRFFTNALNELNHSRPVGSRLTAVEYKIAIISTDTLAVFRIIRNSFDSTLYSIYYPKYSYTNINDIGNLRMAPYYVAACKK